MYFSILVCRFLVLAICGFESGGLGLEKEVFGIRNIAKVISRKLKFSLFPAPFLLLSGGIENYFHDFGLWTPV